MQAQGQFITLRNRGETKAVIAPELGGWLLRFLTHLPESGYVDVLFYDQAAVDRYPNQMYTGSPLLFPLVGLNHLPEGENLYRWQGDLRTLPQHGFARRLGWRVVRASEASVTLELRDSEATRSDYPFEFRHQVTYTLQGQRLQIRQQVENAGKRVMPFSAGIHPYFPAPILPGGKKENCHIEIPACRRISHFNHWESWTAEPCPAQRLPAHLDYSGTLFLTDLEKREVSLVDRDAGLRIRLNYEDAPRHRFLALWSQDRVAPFFCMEPWTALPNSFSRRDTELILLDPGEQVEWGIWLALETTLS